MPTPGRRRRAAAAAAGLVYVADTDAGIRRRRAGRGFRYTDERGRGIRNPRVLARIRGLAVPPAWVDVSISPDADAHVQATGRDARGRKQYRYHPRWREAQDAAKYERVVAFAESLPRIRRRVSRDLARPGLPRRRVLAAVVRLLEATGQRVGHDEYARENASFGLATLRREHVRLRGSLVTLRFPGKGGKQQEACVEDARVADVVRRCRRLPGDRLFQYRDSDGVPRPAHATDVNRYLARVADGAFTAKDFRTWRATVAAGGALLAQEAPRSAAEAKRHAQRAIEAAAEVLGDTPTVSRASYVHPGVLEGHAASRFTARERRGAGSRAVERAVLAYLESDRHRRRRRRRH